MNFFEISLEKCGYYYLCNEGFQMSDVLFRLIQKSVGQKRKPNSKAHIHEQQICN